MSSVDPHVSNRGGERSTRSTDSSSETNGWLRVDSQLADAIRNRDWSETPLGPIESWPPHLRTSLQNALSTQVPMCVCWGEQLVQVYNDAHAETIMKHKHPEGLGRPIAENWSETWDEAGGDFRRAFCSGQPVHREEVPYHIDRGDQTETRYFSYSISPIVDEEGRTDGLLLTARDKTREVLSRRRLQILSEVGVELSGATSPAEVIERTGGVLAGHRRDLPFGLLYLQGSSPGRAELVEALHIDTDAGWSPDWIELPSADHPDDRLAQQLVDSDLSIIELDEYFGGRPRLADDLVPRRAAVAPLPFDENEPSQPIGCQILGLNPHLEFDEDYRTFLTELSRTTSAAFQRARNRAEDPDLEGLKTELTRREIETGKLEQRARVLEKLEKPFYVLDEDFRLVYANDALREDPHFSDQKLLGRSFWDLLAWTKQTELYEAFHRSMKTGETVDLELESPENGRIHRIMAVGTDDGLAVFCEDVTEQHRTAEALERTEARFRAVVDASLDVIAITDSGGRFQFISPAAGDVLGLTPDELRDRPFFELLTDSGAQQARTAFDELLENPESRLDIQVPCRPEEADDHARWLCISGRNLLEADGIEGILLNIRDITDLKHAEYELVEAKERAEEMTRVKSEILTNLSHEIRTPLTSVIGIASLLDDEVSPDHRDALKNIKRGAVRLERTLDSVLNLAEIEDRKLDVSLREVGLADQVRAVADADRNLAEKRGLRLEVHVCDEPTVRTDPSFLNNILDHLIGNAVKFTDSGGVDLWIRSDDTRGIVEVEDTGIGISAQFLPQVFEEFRQESTGLSRSHGGIGIGLTIARRLTETIGGTLTVSTVPGGGSIFTLTLPKADT